MQHFLNEPEGGPFASILLGYGGGGSGGGALLELTAALIC